MNATRLTGLLAAAALALSGCGEQDSTAGSTVPESEPFNQADVDFATQKRTPKASARFYSEVIRTNGECLKG